jgi:hypothetical protein
MIDKETLRKLCEYPITPSLLSELLDYGVPVAGETAEERALRLRLMSAIVFFIVFP